MINALSRFGNISIFMKTTSKILIAQDLFKKERKAFRDSSRLRRSFRTRAIVVLYGIKTLVTQAKILINSIVEDPVATLQREPMRSGKD